MGPVVATAEDEGKSCAYSAGASPVLRIDLRQPLPAVRPQAVDDNTSYSGPYSSAEDYLMLATIPGGDVRTDPYASSRSVKGIGPVVFRKIFTQRDWSYLAFTLPQGPGAFAFIKISPEQVELGSQDALIGLAEKVVAKYR